MFSSWFKVDLTVNMSLGHEKGILVFIMLNISI